MEQKLGELYSEPIDQLGRFLETTNQVETKTLVRSFLLTENTNKEYTHSKEPDSEHSSGVCKTSLEAPLEEELEVASSAAQLQPIAKPTSKIKNLGLNPLDKNEAKLKSLGVRISGALRAAAHGLTYDEVINAGKALEEAIANEAVQSRQGYLVSALKNRYEPSEQWLAAEEQKRKQKESAKLAQKKAEERRRQEVEQITKVRERLAKMESAGEITIYHDRSHFAPNGDYWFEYPGTNSVRRCNPTELPPSQESIAALDAKIKAFQKKVDKKKITETTKAPVHLKGLDEDQFIESPEDCPF